MADQELSLGDLSSLAPFHLGGNIPLSNPVSLFFTKPDITAGHLKFPRASADTSSDCELQALLDSCKPATFGKGTTEVLDPNYRQALCLSPEDFAINMTLPTSKMLRDIQHLLQPAAQCIDAQLYKLNIYSPGGFFKSHVDTPRGPDMFGSLVICLPTAFTGGGLLLKGPAEQQHTHDWSTEGQDTANALQWAAFYSDVEHEILPVTEGHRITLTYNLYSSPKATAGSTAAGAGSSLSTTGVPLTTTFGQQLAAKLQKDDWYPEGATLGFALSHLYAEVYEASAKIKPYMLKGTDMLLYQTVVQLGLKARIVPAMQACVGSNGEEGLLIGDSFGEVLKPLGTAGYKKDYDWYCDYGEEPEEELLRDVCGVNNADSIVWVEQPTKQHWKYQYKMAAYGNEPTLKSWYVAAVLLVEVPKSPRGDVSAASTVAKRQRSS